MKIWGSFITIILLCSVSWGSLPWDPNNLTEIPASNTMPAIPLNSTHFHKGTYFSSVQGDDADFVVWLPHNFDAAKTYNVVMFLSGDSGSMYLLAYGFDELDKIMNDPVYDNYIFVAPDANNFSLWGVTPQFDGPAVVLELKAFIESSIKHSGKTFVMGHSNGGPGAINLSFTPNTGFSAAASVSPTLPIWSPFDYNPNEVADYAAAYAPTFPASFFEPWLQGIASAFGTTVAWDRFDPYMHLRNSKLQMPLSIFTGSKDELGFYHLSQLYVEAAKKEGVTISYSEDSTRGHNIGEAIKEAIDFFESIK